jgi:hypothetical protein
MTQPNPIREGLEDYEYDEYDEYDVDSDIEWEEPPPPDPLTQAYEEVESEVASCFKLGEKMPDRDKLIREYIEKLPPPSPAMKRMAEAGGKLLKESLEMHRDLPRRIHEAIKGVKNGP